MKRQTAQSKKLQAANKIIVSQLGDGRAIASIYTPKGELHFLATNLMLSTKAARNGATAMP